MAQLVKNMDNSHDRYENFPYSRTIQNVDVQCIFMECLRFG